MTNKYLYITLLAVLGFKAEANSQELRNAPRLVVNITIDQLRSDYLEAFLPLYTDNGFKLLLQDGAVFENSCVPPLEMPLTGRQGLRLVPVVGIALCVAALSGAALLRRRG
jgi:hypothetical protein